jgi:ligand-binding sensor domain-containing protein
LAFDSHQNLLIGTFVEGLFTVPYPYTQTPRKIDELNFKTIFDVYQSRDGTMWISSTEGLALLPEQRFQSLFNGYITSICQNSENTVYVSDNYDIYKIQIQEQNVSLEPLHYQAESVVTSLSAKQDTLYVGHADGFINRFTQ